MLDYDYLVHWDTGHVFAAALTADGRVAFAAGPLNVDDPCDAAALADFDYGDGELALWLGSEQDRGNVARIAARLSVDVRF
jgi:hypothetical protein